MFGLEVHVYGALILCAILIGMAKAGVPALGNASAAILAVAIPPKDSVGVLVIIMIFADIIAVAYYSRHAQVKELLRLIPYVFVGLIAGRYALDSITNEQFRPMLALLVGSMLLIDFIRKRMSKSIEIPKSTLLRGTIGVASGFASTVGNAAGPIMSIYLLMMKLPKKEFIGTAAWFFFILNLSKVPVYLSIDVIRMDTLKLSAMALPFVGIGSYLGIKCINRISLELFRKTILWMTIASVIWLLIG